MTNVNVLPREVYRNVDALDPSVRIPLTEEPVFFQKTLRVDSLNLHPTFIVDEMNRSLEKQQDAVFTDATDEEVEEFQEEHTLFGNHSIYEEDWYDDPKPGIWRRFWNFLRGKSDEEEEAE